MFKIVVLFYLNILSITFCSFYDRKSKNILNLNTISYSKKKNFLLHFLCINDDFNKFCILQMI